MGEPLKTILIFTDWYHPGFRAGGPVQSVYNLASMLSRHFDVRVVTRNTDMNSTAPYPGIEPNAWVKIAENHSVQYLDAEHSTRKYIRSLVKANKENIMLINGLFSFKFSLLPTWYAVSLGARHCFIAVRGMLHNSALSVKPVKKQVFLAFARGYGLYRHATLLATGEKEVAEIKQSLGNVRVQQAPNIPLLPMENFDDRRPFRDEQGRLRLLFLGRIAQEKNPIGLLRALKLVDEPCVATFCGTSVDEEYVARFEREKKELPRHIESIHILEMPHEEIGKLLDASDVMVLPSLGENFGHAIFESFVHAVPVIIGNNTQWTGIKELKAGFEVEPENAQQVAGAIKFFAGISKDEYLEWRKGSFAMARTYFGKNNFEQVYLKLFS